MTSSEVLHIAVPDSIQLPKDAKKWLAICERVVSQSEATYQPLETELAEGFGITWYAIRDPWPVIDNRERERILWMSPHSDDLEFAGAAAARYHVQKSDQFDELLLTRGGGREERGFSDKDYSFVTVRIAEAILGARRIGIHRVGVLTLPKNWIEKLLPFASEAEKGKALKDPRSRLGFPETFWKGDESAFMPVWSAIMRQLNPHIIYSPHPNIKVDKHTDHHAVAQVAAYAIGWGTETSFWPTKIPKKSQEPLSFRAWRRYATWTGENTLPITLRFELKPNDKIITLKRDALKYFKSQYGEGYAVIAAGYNAYQGGMPNVGDAPHNRLDIPAAEVFEEVKPATVIQVKYLEDPLTHDPYMQ